MIIKRKPVKNLNDVFTYVGTSLLTKILRENQGNNEIILDFSGAKYELVNINGLDLS